jgi:putative addiction module component (TIGR02574 family)
MSSMMKALGIEQLSVEERPQLIDELWDSLAADSEQLPLTEAQKQELERRLADADANPDEGVPWDVVRAEAEERLRR